MLPFTVEPNAFAWAAIMVELPWTVTAPVKVLFPDIFHTPSPMLLPIARE